MRRMFRFHPGSRPPEGVARSEAHSPLGSQGKQEWLRHEEDFAGASVRLQNFWIQHVGWPLPLE